MEQAVLGIFQEQLAKVIVGFRKEQVNANLLNGKGEIRDVSLNCNVLNESIAKVTPYVELEEIHVSRLGFHVTSWTNLRKAPIIVDIGHIVAKVQEPLYCLPRHQRKQLEMVTEAELIHKMLAEGFKPLRGSGSYGLFDRIVDNMTIEMESFTLEYQTWGKFKTQRKGEWTPPKLQIRMEHLKVVMVDSEGNEASPDEVWFHNRNQKENFMIYKKLSCECFLRLCPSRSVIGRTFPRDFEDNSTHDTAPIELARSKMEVQMAVQRRLRDGAVLAVQMDVTLPQVDVQVSSNGIHDLTHFAIGLQYCSAKDRSFDDPLRSESDESNRVKSKNETLPSPTVRMMTRVDTNDEDDDDNKVKESETISSKDNADTTKLGADASSIGNISTDNDGSSVASWQSDDEGSMSTDFSNHGRRSNFGSASAAKLGSNRPVVILPNGLVVYRSISFTCAIHDISFRGFYSGVAMDHDDDGYIEFIAKGSVVEVIWPKVDRDPGLYAQFSTSFVSLQERFNGRKRTILLGGMQRDDHLSLQFPSPKPQEVGADEFFPLFERRGIRDDPLDLRHLFPTQAMGVKTTVDILKENSKTNNQKIGQEEFETKYKVHHEIGLDEMDLVLDTESFYRMVSFLLDTDGQGFDPRWHTGDWTDLLTPEMLHDPNGVLNLDEHLQEPKQLFLDENSMISSDLFNVTARFTNVEMRLPAAIKDNLRSCDITMKCKETMLVVSSALPRTFLSGKIGNSITGDAKRDNEKGVIDFPNDPKDICYVLDKYDDPSSLPYQTCVSTFRSQITVRRFELNILPVIPFCKAVEPRKLLDISNSTIILSFEGEPPKDGDNQIKITLFVSVLVHDMVVNIDLDLLTGAIFTILNHKNMISQIIQMTSNAFPPSSKNNQKTISDLQKSESLDSIQKTLKGRKILVQRHIYQSRETGGLAIVFCMQQNNISIRGWRQNIPKKCPLRSILIDNDQSTYHDDGGLVEVLNLVDFELQDFEIGVEFDFHVNAGRRTVLKCCLDRAVLKVCDVGKEMQSLGEEKYSIDLCALGEASLPGDLNLSGSSQQIALRLEGQNKRESQSWSVAADIASPSRLHLHAEAIRDVAFLFMEALLLPTWSNTTLPSDSLCPFPDGTIGSLFHSIIGQRKKISKSFILDAVKLDLEEFPDPIVERALRAICKLLFPEDLHVILIRCEIANVLLSIPSTNEDDTMQSLCLHLDRADAITRLYPVHDIKPSDMENVLACKGTSWSTLINTDSDGFYQKLISKQSLLSFDENKPATTIERVVHPFEINFAYSNASVELSMTEGMKVHDIRLIETFHKRLKTALVLSASCLSDMFTVVESMKHRAEKERIPPHDVSNGHTNKHEMERNELVLSRPKNLLRKAASELLLYEEEVRADIFRSVAKLESMKVNLFLSSKERLGLAALLSSRVAGWVRMGCQHQSGQRVAKKTLVWPYWTVLRKELLIVYASPGSYKPLDIVSLVNARIRQLSGGKSQQDVKRAFAVIESSGLTRYFVARNAQEYSLWTNEITLTIRSWSDSSVVAEMDYEVQNGQHIDGGANDSMEADDAEDVVGKSKRGLGNRLASSIQSAKNKAKEISQRRGRTSSNDSLEDFDDAENDESRDRTCSLDDEIDPNATSRRAQLGKKLVGVGQATKSRIGTAIQSARQKGSEISNGRRRSDDDEELQNATSMNYNASADDSMDANENLGQGPRRRRQLGNKFGSALQAAKTVRLAGIRDKIGGITQARGVTTPGQSIGNDLPETGVDTARGQLQSYWTCESCTFINNCEGPCEMCEQDRKLMESQKTLESSRSSFVTPVALPEDSMAESYDTTELPQGNDGSSFVRTSSFEQGTSMRNSRFGFKKRQVERVFDDSIFGDDSFVLKNVHVSNELPAIPAAGLDPVAVPMKMLQGRWSVIVNTLSVNTEKGIERERRFRSSDFSTSRNESNSNECISLEKTPEIATAVDDSAHFVCTEGHNEISDHKPKDRNELAIQDEQVFEVQVFRMETLRGEPEIKKRLNIRDVMNLFSEVSTAAQDSLTRLVRSYNGEQKNNSEEIACSTTSDIAEKVLIFGRILSGLLDRDERVEVRKYQSEVIEGFVNALLECPLPVDALLSLCECLSIPASTRDLPVTESRDDLKDAVANASPGDKNKALALSQERPSKIASLLTACQAEIQRLETQVALERRTISLPPETTGVVAMRSLLRPVSYDSVLPQSFTNALHDSIYEALLNVMAERDEAHAQLIGANVMHVHSLERERKKNELLDAQMRMCQELVQIQAKRDVIQPNLANLFGGKPDDRMAKVRKEIDLKIEAFHQVYRSNSSSDEEIAQLCTQLSKEIASKTSNELEIERLKSVRKSERSKERSERAALEEELKRVKSLLEAEEMKRHEAELNVNKWKALYDATNGDNISQASCR